MNKDIKKYSFQGLKGAYSELAGKKIYPESDSLPCNTFEDMFNAVKDDNADCAIVPIENSIGGRVSDSQRLIPESNLKIIAEYFLEVNHYLLGCKNSEINTIKRVRSHEQALAQCRNNILKNKFNMLVTADTAGAAKEIQKLNNIDEAAIASDLAATTYGLKILEKNFQDSSKNVTRFVVMSKEMKDIDPKSKDVMTTIVYKVRSIPAALYKSLGGFATNGVNLTKLESYIHPQGFDVAQFYIDFEGHPENSSVKLALEDLRFYSDEVNILGVYNASDFRKK
tara:strand:+ start:2087 stop:2932 length:846 start_codon:yes stop_codon:yes gene_type:complete